MGDGKYVSTEYVVLWGGVCVVLLGDFVVAGVVLSSLRMCCGIFRMNGRTYWIFN